MLPNPPMNTLIVYKNCAMNLYGIKTKQKKTDKINRKTVHNSVQDGGLGLPHLKTFVSALKLTRIRKFVNTNRKWTNIALV